MKNTDPKNWIRPEILNISAYHVPDPGNMIKLDAMENPYTWPDEMVQEWQALLKDTALNRYPDPASQSLKNKIRIAFSVPDEMGILLGNGSDEIIQIIAMAVSGTDRCILAPDPGFVMYNMIAKFVGMNYIGVPLDADDFSLDMDAMRAAIKQHQPAVVFLAYPNNPTGNLFDAQQVQEIIQLSPGLVVIDEAYAAFADDSFMNRLGEFPNLVVMRTVSKMGLAGLRLGYLAGPASWLNEFDKVRLPYNINVLTQVSAEFALKYKSVLDQQTDNLCQQRARVFDRLSALPALQVFPSQANFILVRVRQGDANSLFEKLKEAGILIKNLARSEGILNNCLRLTIGRQEENDALLEVLEQYDFSEIQAGINGS
ncbi:MAG: histidinol-phosphate transaminase [Gammaproteobacteria bacterium]|nr:histidinol-phosphate transaminase [Gammaproteobacteria bacterium]